MTSTEWNAAIDAALAKVREQRAVFSSDAYATPQPIGGFMERFACNSIEVEIEALRKPDTPPTPAADANPFVGTNWQVRADTPTPATEEREAVARALYDHESPNSALAWEHKPAHFQENVRRYADAALSALREIRAAEILAAEANERARALGQAAEHINRLEAALRGLLSTVERLDISEGVCCCGDDMATHAEPMSCGHTPVDAGHYHHGNAIQQARDAIEHGAGK